MQKNEMNTNFNQEDQKLSCDTTFDNCLIKISNKNDLPLHTSPIKTNSLIMVFCLEGCVNLKVNMVDWNLTEKNVAIILPGSFIKIEAIPQPIHLEFIEISDKFLQMNIGLKQCFWKNGGFFYKNPIITIPQSQLHVFKTYLDLCTYVYESEDHLYKNERIQSIMTAIIYETLIHCNYQKSDSTDIHNNESTAARKFIELLIRDEEHHRSVEYFAKALCYTPKHFSSLIKLAMGQTPLKIINDHVTECIRHDLIYSDLELCQIADKYKFTNYSFFGKFIKKHLGICPKLYRRKNRLTHTSKS